MSEYKPIKQRAPDIKNATISVKRTPFTSAPQLAFLDAESETITASAVFYDPFNPNLSSAAPANYFISRSINVLSDDPLALRHNGATVDLELSIDTYTFVQDQPIVAEYSASPILPKIRDGDRYERMTTAYVYKDISVPRLSNKVWDGRYLRCVNEQGLDVESSGKLAQVRAQVKELLESPLTPYTVLSVGNRGTTVYPPTVDLYAANYRIELEEFIAINYNSLGLPPRPRGKADNDLYVELPAEPGKGTGRYVFDEGFVAAVLDGPYFLRWANVYRYKEVLADLSLEEQFDCGHIIESYTQQGDAVIILGHLCGVDPDPAPPPATNNFLATLKEQTESQYPAFIDVEVTVLETFEPVVVIPYVESNTFTAQVPLPPAPELGPAVALSLWITVNCVPDGVTVLVDGNPYEVSNGGFLYTFPNNTPPSSIPITLQSEDQLEPAVLCVTTTYITTKIELPSSIDDETYVITLVDTSGSMNSAIPNVTAALADLKAILKQFIYITDAKADKYVKPVLGFGDERYLFALAREYRDSITEPSKYLFLIFENEAQPTYHAVPRNLSSEPSASYLADYANYLEKYDEFILFNCLIFVPTSSPAFDYEVAFNEHLTSTVSGADGYEALSNYAIQAITNWPIDATGQAIFETIQEFL